MKVDVASVKQIIANKQNAAKSPGPRTPAGKARIALNALKTGMFAKLLLLPGENKKDFDRLRAALLDEWRPVGITEIRTVDRLLALFWREGRGYRAETGLYAIYRQCPDGVGGVATAVLKDEKETFSRLQLKDSAIERSVSITLSRLQQLQKDRSARKGLAAQPPAEPPPTPGPDAVT